LFNPKPEAPAVSGRPSRVETAVASGSGLKEGFISAAVLNDLADTTQNKPQHLK
jgi:hypothetical protein